MHRLYAGYLSRSLLEHATIQSWLRREGAYRSDRTAGAMIPAVQCPYTSPESCLVVPNPCCLAQPAVRSAGISDLSGLH
jgi:hypothetical protein